MKIASRLAFSLLVLGAIVGSDAFAFGPAGHYVFLRQVSDSLGASSILWKAITQYPSVAAAGALGPDIGYGENPITRSQYAPWADRFHYDRVGLAARTLLQSALASGDNRKIAFAAGWLTHVIGDMSIHGRYVNIEAGVYLDNPAGRQLHKTLETNAEPFLWVTIGGHSETAWAESCDGVIHRILADSFCDAEDLPCSLVDSASQAIWGERPGDDLRTWYRKIMAGLVTGIGYSYVKLGDATGVLTPTRQARIRDAVDSGVRDAVALLRAAESGDYHACSNRWNLDAMDPQYDHRPIGALAVNVKTANEVGSGTDADIYFAITTTSGVIKEWLLDKEQYNDLEAGDSDDYYLYSSDPIITPSSISGVYLRMGTQHGVGNAWKCQTLTAYVDGVPMTYQVNKEFSGSGSTWAAPYMRNPD